MPGSAPPVPPRRISRPIWLNQPGRLSAMTPSVAIGTLALLLVLIAGLLWTGGDADPVADRLQRGGVIVVRALIGSRAGVRAFGAACEHRGQVGEVLGVIGLRHREGGQEILADEPEYRRHGREVLGEVERTRGTEFRGDARRRFSVLAQRVR